MIVVLLADGFEEIEALTPIDMLRRAGLKVKTVGVSGKAPTGAHGIAVICDAVPEEIELSKITMAIFPGGMPGATNLDKSPFTDKVIAAVQKNGGHLAAICAAPLILGKRGLLEGKNATCYPGFENELHGANILDLGVVTDGNITTAKAMGSALDFAEELIAICRGKSKAEEISKAIYKNEAVAVTLEKTISDDLAPTINEALDEPETVEAEPFMPVDYSNYSLPPLDLLSPDEQTEDDEEDELCEIGNRIIKILAAFGVSATVAGMVKGPRLTRYEIVPATGIKVSKIFNIADDIALGLGIGSIRMEAPIPGKSAVGIEIPNKKASAVRLRNLLESDEFKNDKSDTLAGFGRNITGDPVIHNIASLPHMIVGGSVGMGKTVLINSLLVSTLYKAGPDKVKLLLVDPKQVEFTPFKDIPHLLMPIVYDPNIAAAALKWICDEVDRRYRLFSNASVRNIDAYNAKADKNSYLPRIIVVIDELADLMLQVKDPVETLIMRIAQKARAAGIHLLICTQRPSVNVITGVIKANIPSRLACKVMSNVDSKVLLDVSGAEKLLGRGDALFAPAGSQNPYRIQCAYVSDSEVEAVTDYIKRSAGPAVYDPGILSRVEDEAKKLSRGSMKQAEEEDEELYLLDRQFIAAVDLAISAGKISTSLIQRKLSIGYGKAAKFIDIMEDMGIINEANGQRPREVLMTREEWTARLLNIND